ncbi:MAG: CPBP family intramembrane metalloprotease [Porphyromonadaceae bacterium]|nr:CPBP family intramembrane metalloprotease [Porphyromonadaceae bacterium]
MRPIFRSASSGFRIASLFLLLFVGVIIAAALTRLLLMIPEVGDAGEVLSVYVSSAMQSVFAIGLPAYLVVAFTADRPTHYLKINKNRKLAKKIVFAILIFCVSYPFASFLAQWNSAMELPDLMSGIEEVMRSMEDAAMETTELLLSGSTIGSLVLNLLIIAGMAAISEELFFRGALQQFLMEKYRNGHAAVWITALLFSVVHFQFYGFLPRLVLGALLGYLFLYTRNLWVPVIFHFVNNATVILLRFFWGDTEWFSRVEEMPVTFSYLTAAVVSALITLLLFWIYLKKDLRSLTMNNITDSH